MRHVRYAPNSGQTREELGKLGWAEGRNIRIDNRWGAIDAESLQRYAKELVAQQPDLILTPWRQYRQSSSADPNGRLRPFRS